MARTNQGGMRQGGGRPSGARRLRVLDDLPVVPALAALPDGYLASESRQGLTHDIKLKAGKPVLDQVKPMHLSAVRLRCMGYGAAAIGKFLGVSASTVSAWDGLNWWRPAVQEMVEHLLPRPVETFADMMPAALERLRRDMEGEGAGGTAAAINVIDRLYGKPITRLQSQNQTNIAISFVAEDEEPKQIEGEVVGGGGTD